MFNGFITSVQRPLNATAMNATAIYGKIQPETWVLFNMRTDVCLSKCTWFEANV